MDISKEDFDSLIIGLLDFSEEMPRSYLDYSMSVIVARAIPDAFDGCKPVQRRILYAMSESGYFWDKPYKKSTSTVGEVIGKYHPHGEATVYDAMVRMAQNFSMSVPLIDGQGNFGSIDGDEAASMRYTESRLAKISKYLIQDYEKDTVDMIPNYDGSIQMPSVLPAGFPNLLVNGANGIAVGMATCIPTHNLHEVIDATCAFIDNPNISVIELMQYIKGPDFPTAAIVSDPTMIRKFYETGKGSFIIRGVVDIESGNTIVIKEIPYQVNKSDLMDKIVELSQTEDLKPFISVVRDESTWEGVRIVVECSKNAEPERICNQLYSKTQLQTAFHARIVALDNGIPKQLSLIQVLHIFVEAREKVIIRRTEFLLRTAKARAHILWGLALAVSKLDEVIACIKSSKNPEAARANLMSIKWQKEAILPYILLIGETPPSSHGDSHQFISITEVQARSILEIRLQSLTGLERDKLLAELEELGAKIKGLQALLDSRQKRYELMKSEMMQIKNDFKAPRRSKVQYLNVDFEDVAAVKQEDCLITVSHRGYVKRVPLDVYKVQKRGGRGRQAVIQSDPVEHMFVANTHDDILIFTDLGYVYAIPAYKIPSGMPNTTGRALVNILSLKKGEKVAAALPLDIQLGMSSKKKAYVDVGNEENEQAGVLDSEVEDEALVLENGSEEVDGGSAKADVLADGNFDQNQNYLLFVTSKGYVRRSLIEDFGQIRKNGKTAIRLEDGEYLSSVNMVKRDDEVMITSSAGKSVRMSILEVGVIKSRTSRGVIGMGLKKTERVVSVTIISKEQRDLEQTILTVTSKGFGKRAKISDYRTTGRGAKGVISTAVTDETGPVIGAYQVSETSCLLLMNSKGQMIRCMVNEVRIANRVTKGVRLVKLDPQDSIIHAFIVSPEDEEYVE